MHRPLYESEATLQAEQAVVDLICDRYSCTAFKLPISYRVDFALVRGGFVVAWLEVKCREIPMGRHPSFMISLPKYQTLAGLSRDTSLPAFIAVGWSDAIGLTQVPVDHEVKVGGNVKRNDGKGDIEAMAHIEIGKFRVIGRVKA